MLVHAVERAGEAKAKQAAKAAKVAGSARLGGRGVKLALSDSYSCRMEGLYAGLFPVASNISLKIYRLQHKAIDLTQSD